MTIPNYPSNIKQRRLQMTITSRIFAQGSFGLRKINPENGVSIGHVIRVWTAWDGKKAIGHYLTRREAREACTVSCTYTALCRN